MLRNKLFSLLILAPLLGACATPWEVDEVQQAMTVQPTGGSAFTQALTREYAAITKHEVEYEYEWTHATIYARRGLKAAQGMMLEPMTVAEWDYIPEDRRPPLEDARVRLVADFSTGARERLPDLSARAQVMLECWMQDEWEGDRDAAMCRDEFNRIEPQLRPMSVAQAPNIIRTFTVYFNLNRSDLTATANNVLRDIVAAQAQLQPNAIYVTGHTDRAGSNAYNERLALSRAQRVANTLDKLGVRTTVLDVRSLGENRPAVQTNDGVTNAQNRRVEILFEK